MFFLLLLGVPIAYSLGFSSIVVGYFAFGSFAFVFSFTFAPFILTTFAHGALGRRPACKQRQITIIEMA